MIYGTLQGLDFDVDAAGQVESHQSVNGLVGWFLDVENPIVSPHFEVLHRLLVDVWSSNNAESSDSGGKGDWAGDSGSSSSSSVRNLCGALVKNSVVVGAEPDSDSQNSRHGFSLFELRLNSKGSSETPSNLKRGRIRYLGRNWP